VGNSEVWVHNQSSCCNRGSQVPNYTSKQAKEIAEAAGYRQQGRTANNAEAVYYNNNGKPKYIVRSSTGHDDEAFKGFDTLEQAQAAKPTNRNGTYNKDFIRIGG
jgi:hypothetical protein